MVFILRIGAFCSLLFIPHKIEQKSSTNYPFCTSFHILLFIPQKNSANTRCWFSAICILPSPNRQQCAELHDEGNIMHLVELLYADMQMALLPLM